MFDFLRSKREAAALPEGTVRYHFRIYGKVQFVGFRFRSKYAADQLGLTGWVENKEDGSVELEVQGRKEQIDQLLPLIQQNDYILIERVEKTQISPVKGESRYRVRDQYYSY